MLVDYGLGLGYIDGMICPCGSSYFNQKAYRKTRYIECSACGRTYWPEGKPTAKRWIWKNSDAQEYKMDSAALNPPSESMGLERGA